MRLRTRRPTAVEPHPLAVGAGARLRAAGPAVSLDAAQLAAVEALSRPAAHGYYLWGAAGRGKTMLADRYFAAIPSPHKRRFHFHDFFRDLQRQIILEREPLDASLRRLVGDARAILFDEFHVHDVADGVYLAATLETLIAHGVLLIATSNYEPSGLMPNPLLHSRFETTIELVTTRLDVVHIGAGVDYRARRAGDAAGRGFATGTWCIGESSAADGARIDLDAGGFRIRARHVHEGAASFDFHDLCGRALGTAQYLWLAEWFETVVLEDVPDLATVGRDPLARFANLVDVLYDRDVRLRVCAAAIPERMLDAVDPPRDAPRTLSRLSALERVRARALTSS
ncbi:cell division protein ZapE [Microbacterium candidum]|uniref:Cell division protein ZapE n=1 Tax=Microbacterium candidum TaxID=3041922 RepID=A0ABT7N467_9MICO|nr:cell division protein ZapE [Microbacterium sp. ASV49]MDL9981500.1 cell division protein ZapE [Microbacterium sp. ASV49]